MSAIRHEDAQKLRKQALKAAINLAFLNSELGQPSTGEDIADDARAIYEFLAGVDTEPDIRIVVRDVPPISAVHKMFNVAAGVL